MKGPKSILNCLKGPKKLHEMCFTECNKLTDSHYIPSSINVVKIKIKTLNSRTGREPDP